MFALTKEERLVLISLGLVFLLGISTNYFLKKNPITKNFFVVQKSSMPEYLKINVNKATYDDLAGIPHLGQQTAKNIIAYREENGPFENIEELKEISGIGNLKFQTAGKYLRI